MARPSKHIGRRAGKIFTSHIPDHWVIRSQEDQEDYGVDYEIQLGLENADVVTEDIFKIQLKGGEGSDEGKETCKYKHLTNGRLSYPLKIGKLKQYANLDIPIFLVVVCIKPNLEIWWVNLQNNNEINNILEDAKSQKDIKDDAERTIHLKHKFIIKKEDDIDIIDFSDFLKKYREICNYIWNEKRRLLIDYSNDTINHTINFLGKKLFSFIMERYSRDLETKKINNTNINNKIYELLCFINYLSANHNLSYGQIYHLSSVLGKNKNFRKHYYGIGKHFSPKQLYNEFINLKLEEIYEKIDEMADNINIEEEARNLLIEDKDFHNEVIERLKTDDSLYEKLIDALKDDDFNKMMDIAVKHATNAMLNSDPDFKQASDNLRETISKMIKDEMDNLRTD